MKCYEKVILCFTLLLGICVSFNLKSTEKCHDECCAHSQSELHKKQKVNSNKEQEEVVVDLDVGYEDDFIRGFFEQIINSVSETTTSAVLLSSDYVYTPKGSAVEVSYSDAEFTLAEKVQYSTKVSQFFPNAIKLGEATPRFNCHSYAWYSQSYNSNFYWMNDPTLYITDGSYYEVSSQNVQPGDKVLYISTEYAGIPLEEPYIVHSAIVESVQTGTPDQYNGVNLKTVVSKWGSWGLYRHQGDDCPYIYPIEPKTAYADTVKYYRHAHNYVYNNSYTQTDHSMKCSICDQVISQPHDFYYSLSLYRCRKCPYTSKFIIIGSGTPTNPYAVMLSDGTIIPIDEELLLFITRGLNLSKITEVNNFS